MDEAIGIRSPTKQLLQNSRIYRKIPKSIQLPKPKPIGHFQRTEHLV